MINEFFDEIVLMVDFVVEVKCWGFIIMYGVCGNVSMLIFVKNWLGVGYCEYV